MTTPAKSSQVSAADAASVRQARVAAVLAGAFATPAALAAALAGPLAGLGMAFLVLRAVAALLLSSPAPVLEGTGPASRHAVRQNYLRRAAYAIAAAERISRALAAARAAGQPEAEALARALAAEKTWFAQHIAAAQHRTDAAAAVDGAAQMHGNLLGWNAVLDSRTTPDCRAANGSNFYADRPPLIGYPGTVHAKCRCWPSAAFPGAKVLRSAAAAPRTARL